MENKLEQAKNEIAKELGYESFEQFDDKSTFGYDHRTPEMIDKIAERYHELMDEWISVDDRLPDESGEVIIYTKAHDVYVANYKKNRNLFTAYGIQSVLINDIETTHWKPLPTPPKQ